MSEDQTLSHTATTAAACRRSHHGASIADSNRAQAAHALSNQQDWSWPLTSDDELPAFLVEAPPDDLSCIVVPGVAVLMLQAPAFNLRSHHCRLYALAWQHCVLSTTATVASVAPKT